MQNDGSVVGSSKTPLPPDGRVLPNGPVPPLSTLFRILGIGGYRGRRIAALASSGISMRRGSRLQMELLERRQWHRQFALFPRDSITDHQAAWAGRDREEEASELLMAGWHLEGEMRAALEDRQLDHGMIFVLEMMVFDGQIHRVLDDRPDKRSEGSGSRGEGNHRVGRGHGGGRAQAGGLACNDREVARGAQGFLCSILEVLKGQRTLLWNGQIRAFEAQRLDAQRGRR